MEDKFAAFHSWVNCLNKPLTKPGTSLLHISDAISIGDRGLVAAREIKPNQCILSITLYDPRLLLTPNRAISLLALCDCGAVDPSPQTTRVEPLDALVLFFLHLRAQASRVHTTFERLFGRSGGSLTQHQSTRMLENFAWAWSLVNSRCVYCKLGHGVDVCTMGFPLLGHQAFKQKKYCLLSSKKASDLAIVPFFDFFNHSPTVSVKLDLDENCVRLSSSGGTLPGDQYGFCIPDGLNPSDAYFPTYSDLLLVFPKMADKLDHVLTELHIDVDASEHLPESVNRYWKSVYITSSGPSYFLLLVLYALSFQTAELPSANQLFSMDEDECLALTRPIFLALRRAVLTQTKLVLQKLDSISTEDAGSSFVGQVVTLLRSRCLLFSSLIDESVQKNKR
ncbi:unnamed protein product [Dibothriocephalus latus]|uniref:Uncharacterized protein n=1 Tax=Dibothriocephalus latus TaxID=60516 RepID=A0A3P7P6K5_DIBLA|nr:unnamed protein product [Dibothriocephalus latus]